MRRRDFIATASGVPMLATLSRGQILAPIMQGSASLLPHWSAMVRKVQAGISDAKLLCVGDSTTSGYGDNNFTTNMFQDSYPNVLTTALNSKFSTANGLSRPPATVDSTGVDSRWTLGSGWTKDPTYGFLKSSVQGSTLSGNLVFAPNTGETYDTFDVYYLAVAGGTGVMTITATGGTPLVRTVNASPVGANHVTVSAASAATNNTVTIASSVHILWIIAVEPYLSTTSKVRVGSAGIPGSKTTGWNSAVINGPINSIQAYAPDLTVFHLGINDADTSVATATTIASLTALIAAARVSGDVVLCMPNPISGNPDVANMAALYPLYQSLAISQKVPFCDLYALFGGTWKSAWMYDALHPNSIGYAATGNAVASTILGATR